MLNEESQTPDETVEKTFTTTEDQQESAREDEQAIREPKTAAIGALRKRRIGKVIGKDDEVTDKVKGLATLSEKQRVKKTKKVKLSFDEEATLP